MSIKNYTTPDGRTLRVTIVRQEPVTRILLVKQLLVSGKREWTPVYPLVVGSSEEEVWKLGQYRIGHHINTHRILYTIVPLV